MAPHPYISFQSLVRDLCSRTGPQKRQLPVAKDTAVSHKRAGLASVVHGRDDVTGNITGNSWT